MTQEEIWRLSPDAFNKWRRENDLKGLFELFNKTLPHFEEWLVTFKFSVDFIIDSDKPGSFFYWKTETILLKYKDESGRCQYSFFPIVNEAHARRVKKLKQEENQEIFYFMPYLIWVQKKMKKKKIVPAGYSGVADTFIFTVINAPDVPDLSRTIIAPGYTVVKLGNTKIPGSGSLNFRNLDFSDLDFLEIDGDFSGNTGHAIFYASCRHVKFNASETNFLDFYNCHFFKLAITHSRLYGSSFENCDLFTANFDNSAIINVEIKDCSISGLSFNKVEVEDLRYLPPKNERHINKIGTYDSVSNNYKRLRVLYQNNGHRKEAGEAYYLERLYELKYNAGSLTFKSALTQIWKIDFDYGYPQLVENAKKLGDVITGFISYIIWGFGERPARTLLFTFVVINVYALIYYFSAVATLKGDILNSFYLSSIIFSTLGFGDYTPLSNTVLKLILASESLLGAFTYGLFIAGYANKSKY